MALDKLERNVLRANFRCANPLQMAYVAGELRELERTFESVSVARTSAETIMLEVDLNIVAAQAAEKGRPYDRDGAVEDVRRKLDDIVVDYTHLTMQSFG